MKSKIASIFYLLLLLNHRRGIAGVFTFDTPAKSLFYQSGGGGHTKSFTFNEWGASDAVVPPGIYLCYIDAGTDVGRGAVIRAFFVAYLCNISYIA